MLLKFQRFENLNDFHYQSKNFLQCEIKKNLIK